MATSSESFLDRPAARLLGLGVIACVAAILAVQHWDDVFPPETQQAADPNDPVAKCIAEETRQIEQMVADNPGMEPQKELFVRRAEARCNAMEGEGNSGAPALPGS
jgi:hypothetical protein